MTETIKTETAAPDEWKDAESITGIALGGSHHQGEEIVFGLPTAGGRRWFKLKQERLVELLHTLRSYGEIAAKARSGVEIKSADEIRAPYRARAMPRFGRSPDGSTVAVQFLTQEGIPVAVSMPRKLAGEFADALKTHVKQAARPLQG